MASGLSHPWSLAFLPDGDMLVTERNGKLRLMHDGVLDPEPIAGVPAVHAVRLSGLMEVLPHPKFAQNHLVYLTYTKDVGPDMVATTLARGRLEGHKLVDVKDILICDSWAGDGGSGSRLAWGTDGMLYMTTGASNGNAAQELTSLRGKILRLREDGTPGAGNPFGANRGTGRRSSPWDIATRWGLRSIRSRETYGTTKTDPMEAMRSTSLKPAVTMAGPR